MTFLNTFLYYVCFSSVILIYGIGSTKVFDLNLTRLKNISYCSKVLLSILLSSILGWLVTKGILVPIKMTELVFSYLVIILSIAESTSFVNTIIITLSCICSFALTIPFIFAFKQRNNEVTEEKYYCRLFLYIAILILVISVWDVMWINPEVIQ